MSAALAVVAHHDDHVLWMGGAIQRLVRAGWLVKVIAMCAPDSERIDYFVRSCLELGTSPATMDFRDYMAGKEFSNNNRDAMRANLLAATQGQKFDLVFTHSRGASGEYWARHANHVEVLEVATDLVRSGELGCGMKRLAYFSYDVIYGSRTAACAKTDSQYLLPLTYPELLRKCAICSQAPDSSTNLAKIAFPCPNPEGFEGDSLELPDLFVPRS